jgi:hypothetical protein
MIRGGDLVLAPRARDNFFSLQLLVFSIEEETHRAHARIDRCAPSQITTKFNRQT